MKHRHKQKLVILSAALLVLLNAPVLLLFNSESRVFGLPQIYAYIFGVWLLSCVASFLILKRFK